MGEWRGELDRVNNINNLLVERYFLVFLLKFLHFSYDPQKVEGILRSSITETCLL